MDRDTTAARPAGGLRPDVVVSGTGVVSAAGLGTAALWQAVTERRVLTRPVTRFDLTGYPARQGAEVPPEAVAALDALVPPHRSLAARYLAAAALEGLRDAGLPARSRRRRLGVFVGTVMATRPMLDRGVGPGRLAVPPDGGWARPGDLLAPLRAVLDVTGPAVLLAPGCAAGNSAIAAGCRALAAGEVDVAVCAGVSELSLEILAMFTSLRALAADTVRPFDVDRRGTIPGEGAAVLVLEPAERVRARGLRPSARILACVAAADAHNPTRPHPEGAGLVATVRGCLERAGLTGDDIDWVSAHGTGTPASDGIEARAVARALPGRRRPVVSSVKGQLGHAEGAAAALEAVLAVRAMTEGFIPGNVTLREPDPACGGIDLVEPEGRRTPVRAVLNQAFGFGGGVSTVLLGRVDDGAA